MGMNWHEVMAEMGKVRAQIQPLEARFQELKQLRSTLEKDATAKGLKPHACCNVAGNLVVIEKGERITGMFKGQHLSGDKMIKQCKACGAKHHEVQLDPVVINTKGSPTG